MTPQHAVWFTKIPNILRNAMEMWELSARAAIAETISAYTYNADRGRFDAVAALFTADAVLEIEGIGGAVARGRDEIRAFFGGVGGDVTQTAPPGRMQHHISSVWIEVASPTAARAAAYFTVMTGAGVDHWGTYRDDFVPDGDRWSFARRRVRTDGVTPGGWADSRR